MLLQRVVTAVILLIIIIGALLISNTAFMAVAAVAVGCCMWEWLRICKWPSAVAAICAGLSAAALFALEMPALGGAQYIQSGNVLWILSTAAVVIWAAITCAIFTKRSTGWNIPFALGGVLAWVLIPAAWFSLMYLFKEKGTIYMLSVLALVWVADIMAFFGGRAFGGTKMSPAISPKKTWSGALTAFVSVVVFAFVLNWSQPDLPLWSNAVIQSVTPWAAFLILFIAVLYSIAGDLFESALKRTGQVKDSSNLLPGHGGFFDRLDAQLSVLPLAVFVILFLQGF